VIKYLGLDRYAPSNPLTRNRRVAEIIDAATALKEHNPYIASEVESEAESEAESEELLSL